MTKKYEHNFTLREDPNGNPPRDTSSKARKAYTDALENAGFHPYAASSDGTLKKLPHSARVGEFEDGKAARKAIDDAEKAAESSDPGKFFIEASTLTPYAPLRIRVIATRHRPHHSVLPRWLKGSKPCGG